MMRVARCVAVLSALGLAACGGDSSTPQPSASSVEPSTTQPAAPTSYRWSGLVLGSSDDDIAIACFGPILASDPPAGCTGWPIEGLDWATTPGVVDYGKAADTATPPVTSVRRGRYANVTLIGHIDDTSFVLDAPPTETAPGTIVAGACVDLVGADGPTVSLHKAFEILTAGQREGRIHLTASDPAMAGDSVGETVVAGSYRLEVRVLVNDDDVQKWVAAHLTGVNIHLCGLMDPL